MSVKVCTSRQTCPCCYTDTLVLGYLQIVQSHQSLGRLTDISKPEGLFRIAFIERKHKRRIVNFEELLSSCNTWQLPEGTRYDRVECWAINLDDADKYMENLSQLRSVDVLVCGLLSAV